MVSTPPFQGGSTGSNPVGVAWTCDSPASLLARKQKSLALGKSRDKEPARFPFGNGKANMFCSSRGRHLRGPLTVDGHPWEKLLPLEISHVKEEKPKNSTHCSGRKSDPR